MLQLKTRAENVRKSENAVK